MATPSDPAAACPVDHKTRQAWLDKARDSGTSAPPASPSQPASTTHFSLDQSRQVSSIPRAISSPSSPHPNTSSTTPYSSLPTNPNAETATPETSASGNWIYPSEQMFFDAMRRKSFSPEAGDMRSIVPIHNAVNERAWAEIRAWERPFGADQQCGGPRLVSFSGESKALTPRARWNTFVMGYTRPFDRHDWVVDRCGTRVDYVIDFYEGKGRAEKGQGLNFYLDVRPKLNSWEGVRMRMSRAVGWS